MPSLPKDHRQKPDSRDGHELEKGYYMAAAFGGFLVGFGELIRAGSDTTNVTVLRISAVLREQFSPLLGAGWIALSLLAIFSTILCSIYRPASRKEAFTLGLSVFAILAAFTPQPPARSPQDIAKQQLGFLSFMSQAVASPLKAGEEGDYYFQFTNQQRTLPDKSGLISVYDKSERYLVFTKPMDTTKISKLRLVRGDYVVKFECGGCASLRVQLTVEKLAEAAIIRLSNSRVPLSFQRLFNADIVDIINLPDTELARVERAYSDQRQ